MKNIKISVLLTCLCCLLIGMTGCRKDSYRLAFIDSFSGDCLLNNSKPENQIYEGRRLEYEDKLFTNEAAELVFKVDDDKRILMSENSAVTVEASGDTEDGSVTLKLDYGRTLIEIENKLSEDDSFEVETPNATMAVRGTKFAVSYNKELNISGVEVYKGSVEVTSKEDASSTLLQAGDAVWVNSEGIKTKDNYGIQNNNDLGSLQKSKDFGDPYLAKINALFEDEELLLKGRPVWEYSIDELVNIYEQDQTLEVEYYSYGRDTHMEAATHFNPHIEPISARSYIGENGKMVNSRRVECKYLSKNYFEDASENKARYDAMDKELLFLQMGERLKRLGLTTPQAICDYLEIDMDVVNDAKGTGQHFLFPNNNVLQKLKKNGLGKEYKEIGYFILTDPAWDQDSYGFTIFDIGNSNKYIDSLSIHVWVIDDGNFGENVEYTMGLSWEE